ncbi:MAG TPA: class I SAM-dependent methyltransferase [Thermoanaerobaculia bacterium]
MTIEEWNQRYREAGDVELREPERLLVEAVRGVKPGRALDLACGTGRNAIWLARNGWDVVALDGSPEALRIVRELAGVTAIETRLHDLEAEPLPFDDATFDLAVLTFFLHRPLFDEIRRVLRPGGLAVAVIRTSGINPAFCVEPGELAARFADWEVLQAKDEDVAEMVARKGSGVRAQGSGGSAGA